MGSWQYNNKNNLISGIYIYLFIFKIITLNIINIRLDIKKYIKLYIFLGP
jgi:hypothetical protein